jgi:hypothetical protein
VRNASALALIVACGAITPRAHAYVRSRSAAGTPTQWAANCVFIQPDSTGSPDLDPTATFAAIQASMQIWRTATQSCGYLVFNYVNPAALEAHFDGINTIKFRTDRWCHPDDAQSHDICYSAAAAGITTVFYIDRAGSAEDGRILDADVELNDINFTFDFVDPMTGPTKMPRPNTSIADFENTLVHELGHVQGLDHTCKDSATPPNEVDDTGKPPPDCTKLDQLSPADRAKITEATMYNSATPGETKKRSPETDDIDGICNAYPIAKDPKKCATADLSGYGKGCAMGGGGPIAPWLLILALFATLRRGDGGYPRRRPDSPARVT